MSHNLPPPPNTCKGFFYTVQHADTLIRLSQAFDLPMKKILDVNPQIKNPSWIYPGQLLCIPISSGVQNLKVSAIDFFDEKKHALPVSHDLIKLAPITVINVYFSVEVSTVFFFNYPIDSDVFDSIQLFGTVDVKNDKMAQLRWDVPQNTRRFIFVIGCSGNLCGKSNRVGVYRDGSA